MNQNTLTSLSTTVSWKRRVAIVCCLIVGVVYTCRAMTGRALATSVAPSASVSQIPIEQIQLGQRVVGHNPLREQTQLPAQIDHATWRRIDLETNQAGVRYDLSFLRPSSWLETQGAIEGGTFHLVMHEIGVDGPVRVVRIAECPPIEPDDGAGRSVVTGTMSHPAENVLSVVIDGEREPLGVTTTHPMWSEDRQEFVVAGQLKIGERLRRSDGTLTQVTRITPHTGPPVMVHNLEVDGEHVYCVSQSGLLVHNSCYDDIDDLPITGTTGAGAARPPRHHVFPQEQRQWFKDRGFDIDRVTVPMDAGSHSAIHTMGWNEQIMKSMLAKEGELGRQLTSREIWEIGWRQMRQFDINGLPIVHFNAP